MNLPVYRLHFSIRTKLLSVLAGMTYDAFVFARRRTRASLRRTNDRQTAWFWISRTLSSHPRDSADHRRLADIGWYPAGIFFASVAPLFRTVTELYFVWPTY